MKKFLSCAIVTSMLLSAAAAAKDDLILSPKDATEHSPQGITVAESVITNIDDGGYVGFGELDFTGIKSVRIKANISTMYGESGETFRLYIDDPLSGTCIGYILINEEKSEPTYYGTNIDNISGKHKLYLKQNYSHTKYLNIYELVLSEKEWIDPNAVTPVSDDKIIDNYHDTRTATNAYLKIADFEEAGPVKEGTHDVGMFYHNWHVHNTEAYVASEIISEYPEAKTEYGHEAWPAYGPAWWAEPVYGFYDDMDYWHYRKAAELMADA